MHIGKMQSRRRLVQNIDCLSRTSLTQLCCQLDTLGFSAGQSRRRLSQTDIRKPDIIQGLHLSADTWYIFKEMHCFFYGHVQNIIDILSFVFHFQCLSVVTSSLTYFTWNIDIRQEMHLDLDDSISAAGLTSSSFDVKTESSFFIASCFCIWCCREQIPDQVKYSGIGCRIGSRSPPDRRLVDIDHLVQLFQSLDAFVSARNGPCTVQVSCQTFIEDLVHK